MNRLVIPSIVAMGGSGGGKIDEDRIIIKDSVIPEATEEQLGKIYCYSGETNATYIHGYIYECKGAEEAQSITTDFNPGKMAFDYEAATHPYKTFTSDAEAMSDFIISVLKIDNPYDIVSGSLVVDENTIVDPNQHLEMWFVNCTNKNGQEVLANYKINASDLEAYGFQFTNPAADYHANEPIAYTFNWVTTIGDIHWERINVQPSSAEEVALLSITTAPSGTFVIGSKYYNSTEKKIYTATVANSWTNATVEDPSFNAIYLYSDQAYVWDGNSLELFELEEYQRKLVSGVNIKSINGSSVLGSGNLAITTYQSFNSSWPTNTTFAAFLSAVNSDTAATAGMAYLGELSCSGLPMQGNVEATVEIQNGPNGNKTIYVVITSGTDAPYRWEYTYWNNGSNVSGWVSFIPQNKEVTITSTTPTLSLEDNTFYNCTNALTSLSVTLPASNMYGIEIHFTTGSSFSGVTFPSGTLYTGTLPTWEANKSYLISIQKNVVIAAEIKAME